MSDVDDHRLTPLDNHTTSCYHSYAGGNQPTYHRGAPPMTNEMQMDLFDYLDAACEVCERDSAEADVIFFGVRKTAHATIDGLRAAISAHVGVFCEVDLFDGDDHNFIELGGWVGDQGAALRMIGLGAALGMWKLLTPVTMLGFEPNDPIVTHMAGLGYVSMQVG